MKIEYVDGEEHELFGRVYDLAQPLHIGISSWEELLEHKDAHYVWMVDAALTSLGQRVQSINLVIDMLDVEQVPEDFESFPISRYDWLKVIVDVFLARFLSIADCAAILVNETFQAELGVRSCNSKKLKSRGVDIQTILALENLERCYGDLRLERNSRFHHGHEREFSQDAATFRMASTFEKNGHGLAGKDRHGRPIDIKLFYNEAVDELAAEFEASISNLNERLGDLYELLLPKFNSTFGPLRKAGKPLSWE